MAKPTRLLGILSKTLQVYPTKKMNKPKQKICHQCQNKFDCNPHDCWCVELPKVMPIKEGVDCLCPECLKKAINTKSR